VKPAAFDYTRAESVAHAVALLQDGKGGARILAGGQSLGPMLNLRLARPARLIDVKRVAALRALAADACVLRVGAAWTHAEIEDGAVEDASGMLRHVARGIAYRAVRNRGTLGGSLAHADPAADWVAAMAALGAAVVMQGPVGERRVPADGFVLGAFATALGEADVLTAIELPRLPADARWGFCKICRKSGEYAQAIGAAVLDTAHGLARVLCGATGGAPVLLAATAARLAQAGPQAAQAAAAEEIASRLAHVDAIGGQLLTVAARRALRQLETARP